jgi:hypothetical protein
VHSHKSETYKNQQRPREEFEGCHGQSTGSGATALTPSFMIQESANHLGDKLSSRFEMMRLDDTADVTYTMRHLGFEKHRDTPYETPPEPWL